MFYARPKKGTCVERFVVFAILVVHGSIIGHVQNTAIQGYDPPILLNHTVIQEKKQDEELVVPVFYNVFANGKIGVRRVKAIVTEQMQFLRPMHKVFVRSIGLPFHVQNSTLLQHDERGTEFETLGLFWDYCKVHVNEKVIYIHTKGSFHRSPKNHRLRRFLTRGVASEECTNLPDTCNICSSRMSPLPHPHTSGNMWLARCNYVQNLFDPRLFRDIMEKEVMTVLQEKFQPDVWATIISAPYCLGLGRYAAEHWIHSHPSVMPCDLYKKPDFVWGHNGVPPDNFEIQLAQAPRFSLQTYVLSACRTILFPDGINDTSLYDYVRLAEYQILYDADPNTARHWWKKSMKPV